MTREEGKALVLCVLSLMDPSEMRELRRELALEFFGAGIADRDREHEERERKPLARAEIVRRHPKDDR